MVRINKTDTAFNIYNKNKAITKKEVVKTKEDRIEISNAGRDYQFAMNKLKEAPAIREEKVASIRKEIEAGTYKVDSNKIADKILDNLEVYKEYSRW